MPRSECPSCGVKLKTKGRFCPECGSQVDAQSGETAVAELPPSETGPVPVETLVAERRLFGIPPSTILLVAGIGALAAAIALFAAGRWPWALIVLGLGLFVLTGFVSQTRRLPGEASGVGRASVAAIDTVRARAGAAVETVAAHGTVRIELARLRREVGELAAQRGELLRELGEAVYEGNRSATKQSKDRIGNLDQTIKEKELQMTKATMEAQERIERAHAQVRATRILARAEDVPAPAPVPEPFPPPDEGQPPEPARVPEPFPPPDEGDRPQQPTVPEPGPQ